MTFMRDIKKWYDKFECWFNANLGWFFVNGNKINQFDEIEKG